jgi:taurine dioxygenase
VIHGIDLKRIDSPEPIRFIRDVLLERKVVFFRDQNLSEDEQVAFGRQFGELDAFPFGPAGDNPFILEIRHGRNSPGRENGWHTDVTWMEQPSLGSIAQLIEGPPVGGDTLFSDSHASYLGLPTELQRRIEHLHGINDYRPFLAGRGPANLPDELVEKIKKEIPFGVSHPLARTHPETGKTALYIHGGFLRHESLYDERTGEQLERKESEAIVRELLAQHSRPEYVCRFKWAPGSIAFWDNRAVQHYAASDYHPHKRILRRVTVSGDKPFYNASN